MKLLLTLAALPLAALPLDDEPEFVRPDPTECSVCGADPARMEAAGIVSHGEFRFGETDTEIISRLFTGIPIRWIEGPHVKLGFADVEYDFWFGGGDGLRGDPDEPTEGAGSLRELATGALALEPWQKTHVYLERVEALHRRIADLLGVEDRDFPTLDEYEEPIQPPHQRGRYMGEGPHLGQAGKFELLLLPGQPQYEAYLEDSRGLDGAHTAQHLVPTTDAMTVTMHQMDGDLWDDTGLHGYVVHMLTHAMLDSYRHYSYTGPLWLSSGLAHLLERELTPSANTFCGGHESTQDARDLRDWTAEARKLASKRRATPLTELMERESLRDFTLADHVTSWSMVRFLVTEHPEAFAAINADVRGLSRGKQPVPLGALSRAHQDAFARHLGLTYEEFDKAWAKWAKKQRQQA